MNFIFIKRLLPFIIISLLQTTDIVAYSSKTCVECSEVIFTGTLETHSDSVRVSWFDFNIDPVEWEIEIGIKGFEPSGIPNVNSSKVTEFTFKELNPGSAYHIYIRTVCDVGMSAWAGPFFFRTHYVNPSQCQSDLEIKDDNCNISNSFGIEINGFDDKILGADLFINGVNLIIEHSFPSDLEISLISPMGQEVELSNGNGIASNHYGDPSDQNCENVVNFSMNACESILDGPKPYIGSYLPEGELSEFHNGESPDGVWTLQLCDNAPGDIGILRFVEIDFTEAICQLPQNAFINNIQDNEATLNWESFEGCDQLVIEYGEFGFESGSGINSQVSCADLFTTIDNLIPGTDYEIEIQSLCGADNSPISCRFEFTTSCHPVSISENFDDQTLCEVICANSCVLDGFWFNGESDNYDWLVRSGPTPTDFTGPLSDINGIGQYVYIESFGTDCNINLPAYLESNCISITSNDDDCDMSFRYHMNGIGINKLILEISADNGINWNSIWEENGDKGNQWNRAFIDLGEYEGSLVKFRFAGYGSFGSFGDIAIDNIEFYGSLIPSESLIKYYVDEDGDGHGNSNDFVFLCFDNSPPGYSDIGGDCDDNNEAINPEAEEIPCNLIDENCNGLEDDPIQDNPLGADLINLVQENCGDSFDGQIEISGSGGSPPYSYYWNNGDTLTLIDSLTAGVYFCTVVDATGCIMVSDFFEINTENDITIFISQIINPDCNGSEDGLISINQSGGTGPYSYLWSNDDTTSTISNLSVGTYQVTITDANSCVIVSNPISLDPQNLIGVSVQNKVNVSCNGLNDGQILLNISSGSPPFDFNWSNGDTLLLANDLEAGSYNCTVSDANGCIGLIENIGISEPEGLSVRLDAIEHNICFGGSEGSIETSILGGTPPFSFSWSSSGFNNDIFDLEAGFYDLTVTDKEFCSATFSQIEVRQPEEIIITVDSIKNVNCLLSSDGYISVEVEGGISPYQYFWNYPGSDTNNIDGLTVRDYRLTVLDAFGCKQIIDGIEINHNNVPLELDIFIDEDVVCHDDSNGQISATTVNGTKPFDFNWSIGERNITDLKRDSLVGLSSGTYNVTVTDSEGCVGVTQDIELEEPPELLYNLIFLSSLQCFGDQDGLIDVKIEGGTKPYLYNWSNNMSTEDIDSLKAGFYTLITTDKNGCSLETQEFEIQQPEELIINTSSESAINMQDNGSASVSVSGGVSPYFYSWDENTGNQITKTATGLFPGEYFVTITDSRECVKDTIIVVDNTTATNDLDFVKVFEVYPNPASSEFTIDLKLEKTMSYMLSFTDILGRSQEIFSQQNSKELVHIMNVGSIKAGIYFILFETQNYRLAKKIVIIK